MRIVWIGLGVLVGIEVARRWPHVRSPLAALRDPEGRARAAVASAQAQTAVATSEVAAVEQQLQADQAALTQQANQAQTGSGGVS